ncbi:MAG TPA: enoyl-CoA hydratase [Pirellulales bacterium]|jgi:enoyl-CoA hydratase/carnithine racemase
MTQRSTTTDALTSHAGASAPAGSLVGCEHVDRVAVLTLANPARRNALSRDVLMALRDQLRVIAGDAAIKCVILKADGPVFSSGHDLREVATASREQAEALFTLCTEVMEAIRHLPQPVIAQVQGVATAAGCQLVATCDLVIAAETATFATPGVRIGLFCSTPAVALARAVSTKKAMEMLLTGDAITATEAERIGLVNRVVPSDQLAAETLKLARQIASASGAVLALGKRTFYEQLSLDRPAAYKVAECAMVENAALPDAQEGIDAFLNKRPPQWRT